MESNRILIACTFSLIVVIFSWVIVLNTMSPLVQANLNTLDEKVAFFIDTLSSVDEGIIEIPIEPGTISSVKVSYETKNKDKEYRIRKDGWYVTVNYNIGRLTEKSFSAITTYTGTESFEFTVFSPKTVCIKKSSSEDYARLVRC